MAAGMSRRDKFLSYNTLVCLIQALEGHQTTVDLRGGRSATGKIVQCDSAMNISLEHVLFRDESGEPTMMDNMMIKSRLIRYIHIPAEVDMRSAMSNFLSNVMGYRAPKKSSLKQTRLQKRQAQTLEDINMMKMEKQKQQSSHV